MARRSAGFDLVAAAADPGFTPGQRDVPPLLEVLVSGSAEARDVAEKALRRAGDDVVVHAVGLARDAGPAGRARLAALVGRMDGAESPEGRAFLLEALRDEDGGVRRRAAGGLSRARSEAREVEAALVKALEGEADAGARAALVEALGKVGGDAAKAALAALGSAGDARTAAELRRAQVRAARPGARAEASAVDVKRALDAPLKVWLDCRRGLLPVLLEEAAALRPVVVHRVDGSAVAEVALKGALEEVFASRTWSGLSIASRPFKVSGHEGRAAVVARALASSSRAAAALTSGPLRYRLAWGGGGKRRAEVFEVAASAAAMDAALVNDPAGAVWEVVVREKGDKVAVEWCPSLVDPRFSYRSADVPAASHPTIAAALSFLGGAGSQDVVWDPFVGSALELCERSLRGPYARLLGTDVEAEALEAARVNLSACGARFELKVHDAARGAPRGLAPSLVITNPPMGRRVHRSGDLRQVLVRFVEMVGRALGPGGRFVWVSPFPGESRAAAARAGLVARRCHVVDMGGFDAEIQAWERPAGRGDQKA